MAFMWRDMPVHVEMVASRRRPPWTTVSSQHDKIAFVGMSGSSICQWCMMRTVFVLWRFSSFSGEHISPENTCKSQAISWYRMQPRTDVMGEWRNVFFSNFRTTETEQITCSDYFFWRFLNRHNLIRSPAIITSLANETLYSRRNACAFMLSLKCFMVEERRRQETVPKSFFQSALWVRFPLCFRDFNWIRSP